MGRLEIVHRNLPAETSHSGNCIVRNAVINEAMFGRLQPDLQ